MIGVEELTPTEKLAGRLFKSTCQLALTEKNEVDPPSIYAHPHLANYRHLCPKKRDISTAAPLREVYVYSPAYWVSADESGELSAKLAVPGQLSGAEGELIRAGRFGFIYREGGCSCGSRGRSREGWFVIANQRPPLGVRTSSRERV